MSLKNFLDMLEVKRQEENVAEDKWKAVRMEVARKEDEFYSLRQKMKTKMMISSKVMTKMILKI